MVGELRPHVEEAVVFADGVREADDIERSVKKLDPETEFAGQGVNEASAVGNRVVLSFFKAFIGLAEEGGIEFELVPHMVPPDRKIGSEPI